MIHQWKKVLLEGASEIFQRGRNHADADRLKDLHAKIGELTVERDFLADGLRLLPGRSARQRSSPTIPGCRLSGSGSWRRLAV